MLMLQDPMKNGPIFIVGAPRSGTTLFQYMLRSHPRISIPTGESHFFLALYQKREQYGDLHQLDNVRRVYADMYQQSSEFLKTDFPGICFDIESMSRLALQANVTTIPETISLFYKKNAEGEGKKRWGEKTPWYVLHMHTIHEMFPNAQFIHLIRDGRDVALSLFRRSRDFGVYNIMCAAEHWSNYVARGQSLGKTLGPTAYLELHYEELLKAPEIAVRRICNFLGEEFHPSVVEYKTSSVAGKTPLLQQPIVSTNFEKWRTELTKNQTELFESVAGDLLRRNGYKIISCPIKNMTLLKKATYRLHNTFCNLLFRKKLVNIWYNH